MNEADASAKGAKSKTEDTSGKDVNGKSDEQLRSANKQRKDNTGTRPPNTSSTPKAATGDKEGGSGSTSVQVAAAVAINVVTTRSLRADQRRPDRSARAAS